MKMSGHERSNITVCQSNYSGHKIVVLVVYQALKRRILMYRDIHLDHPLNKISYTIDRHRPCDRVAPPSKPTNERNYLRLDAYHIQLRNTKTLLEQTTM